LCVLNRQPTWPKITRTVHGKGQRAESKDQRADMCTDGQPQTSSTDDLCVLTDTHGRPVCADGHPRIQPTWAKIARTVHGKGQSAESKDQRADMCTDGQPRTSYMDVLCVLMDSHRCPPRTSCVCWRTPTDVLCVLNKQPTWAQIIQRVHGMGQLAEFKDQRADMCTDGQPRTSCVHGVLCVLADTHGRPVCTEQTAHRADMCTDGQPRTSYSPRGPKSPEQSTGRASVLSLRTSVLICVLMDSDGHPVCADGHPRTATDYLCVLTDTHGHPVQPTWAKITRTVHGKGKRAESKDQRVDMCTDGQPQTSCSTGRVSVLSPRTNLLICVLMDSHRRPVCADGHTRTATDDLDVLCVLNRQPTWAKITQTVNGKGQHAESKDQHADKCTDGQPRTSCVC
ncbi:unnamed protein product, partial [Brassica rapa]